MNETFRQFLDRLRGEEELVEVRQRVDIRHIATLVDQSDKALFFHDVIGYDVPVVSGVIRTRKRSVMRMGCSDYGENEQKLRHATCRRRTRGSPPPRVTRQFARRSRTPACR